jgi:hypothetical protein
MARILRGISFTRNRYGCALPVITIYTILTNICTILTKHTYLSIGLCIHVASSAILTKLRYLRLGLCIQVASYVYKHTYLRLWLCIQVASAAILTKHKYLRLGLCIQVASYIYYVDTYMYMNYI